jgi:cobalt-zinc-cadmium efflux system outer membrane protein
MRPGALSQRTRSSTTARSTWACLGALALLLGPASAGAASPLDEVTGARRVCAAGPGAALARAQRMRGEAAVSAASVLPNPSLVVEHQQTLRGPRDQQTTIGLSAPLGLGGRRFLLQDAAQARRAQALSDARASLFEAALSFREAFAAAALDAARLAVLTEQQRALDASAAAVRALAKSGESAGYDVLRQETQARVHRRLVESTRAKAEASRLLLEAWIGEEVTLPQVDIAALAGGPRTTSPAGGEAPTTKNPRVESLEAAARASGFEAQAARRRWVPDIQVFAGYRALTGAASETGHGVTLQVTVPLTFFDHGQGEAAQAEAEQAVARAAAGSLKREGQASAKGSAARLQILEASVAALDQAAADAGALQAKAEKLYAAGEASIADLVDAFRAAEEARLARIDAAQEIAAARLDLMRARGTQLDPALDKACGAATSGGAR